MKISKQALDGLAPGVEDVMDAAWALCDILNKHDLTIADLREGFNLAFDDGKEYIQICLTMLAIALEE
jgi:hypothetical protein